MFFHFAMRTPMFRNNLRILEVVFVCWAFAVVGGCGKDDKKPTQSSVVRLSPTNGAVNVAISQRIQAEITRADANKCRFVQADTTFSVTKNGIPVDGSLVYFIDGLRIDFTPAGLWDYSSTYDIEVSTACSAKATTRFTTIDEPAGGVGLEISDGFRVADLAVSEPQAIASVLGQLLGDANIVLMIVNKGAAFMRAVGSEGVPVFDGSDPFLHGFKDGGFLFPINGVLKWPFFQIEGSVTIPISEDAQTATSITLQHFEISGQFSGTSPNIEIINGAIRASSSCAEICAIENGEIALVCGNPETLCDGEGNLNLIGTFSAPTNNLRPYQTITATPVSGSTDISVTPTIDMVFARAVNAADPKAVVVELRDASENQIAGTTTIAPDGLSASFNPNIALAPGSTYTALLVASTAVEITFTTAP